MIEIAKGHGGFPWHGLYRSSTGKITTPTGMQIDAPWPLGFIDNGDCYQVKIDGLAVPTTTPEETLKGMSWVNYGLICGVYRALYGVQLGPGASIYIDSHNKPWLMRVVVGGSRATASIGATVSLKRFGVIGPVEATITYPLAVATFSTSPDYPYFGAGWGTQLDISRDGRRHLIGIERDGSPVPNGWLGYACIATLTVSGSPDDGDVAINLAVIADEVSRENWGDGDIWSGAGPSYPAVDVATGVTSVSYGGSKSWPTETFIPNTQTAPPGPTDLIRRRNMIAGARFSALGAPEVLMFRAEYHRQLIIDNNVLGAWTVSQHGRDIEAVTMSLEVDNVKIGESGLKRTTSFVQNFVVNVVNNTPHIVSENFSAVETTDEGGTTYERTYAFDGYRYSTFFGYQIASGHELEKYGMAMRLSNSVYSLRSWGYSPTTGSGEISPHRFIFGPAVGIIGRDDVITVLPASSYDDHPAFATEHPVTGEVVRSTTRVCWV